MKSPIYLDYAAATPLDNCASDAMQPFLRDQFYNPSSSYRAAKIVREALADARARVAHWLGAKPAEVLFTAGATESINLAISGVMRLHPDGEVLVSAVEHEAVLAAARQYNHALVPVTADGTVDLAVLKKMITGKTVLISVGYANNEVGTIQPLNDVAALVRETRRLRALHNNTRPLYLHTDASQAACYLDLHVSRLGVDMLTLNGAKMYGPKQTGALFVKGGIELEPLIRGGGQEMGMRSGTENVAGCIGFAAALDMVQSDRKSAGLKAAILRDELQRRLGAKVNGNQKRRLPHILHVSWPGIDGERLLILLDEQGIMASTGSACAANKRTASHVLAAMGLSNQAVAGSLRLSLGRRTTAAQVAKAAATITQTIDTLR